MTRQSAGLLLYRVGSDRSLEVFLVHPGGPIWAKKDAHAWSIPKGEYLTDDEPLEQAEREFEEEVGLPAPPGARVDLGEVRQASGKRVRAWAIEAPGFTVDHVVSNEFEMEWPPKSGHVQAYPEVDRAEWMTIAQARMRIVAAQGAFFDRLLAIVAEGAAGSP